VSQSMDTIVVAIGLKHSQSWRQFLPTAHIENALLLEVEPCVGSRLESRRSFLRLLVHASTFKKKYFALGARSSLVGGGCVVLVGSGWETGC
jgi:hypothetical protein